MEKTFDYSNITLQDIENNSDLIFICDGDKKVVKVERED